MLLSEINLYYYQDLMAGHPRGDRGRGPRGVSRGGEGRVGEGGYCGGVMETLTSALRPRSP